MSDFTSMAGCDDVDSGVADRKPVKRGFAKIDVVDVILSEEGGESRGKGNIFDQISDQAGRRNGSGPDFLKGLLYEPTYRQAPKVKFDPDLVKIVLIEHLEKEMREMTYSEKEAINAVKRIAYHLRKAVKHLYRDRYRFVVQSRIIEKVNQGMEARTGFLWDSSCDSYAAHTIETHSFSAYAVVYALYKE